MIIIQSFYHYLTNLLLLSVTDDISEMSDDQVDKIDLEFSGGFNTDIANTESGNEFIGMLLFLVQVGLMGMIIFSIIMLVQDSSKPESRIKWTVSIAITGICLFLTYDYENLVNAILDLF